MIFLTKKFLYSYRFCFAHGGGSFPFTVGRIEHGYRVNMIIKTLSNYFFLNWWPI